MSKWGETYQEIWVNTEWAAIATTGEDGAHIVGCWGKDLRALSPSLEDTVIVPAGSFHQTEANLTRNPRIEILMASQQVQGSRKPGQGCSLIGSGQIQTSGEYAELAMSTFPWARGALVIRVESVKLHL